MYAIIKTGGKQYRIAPGDVIDVELLDSERGSAITFPEVLFFHDGSTQQIGKPILDGITVSGELIADAKGPKISSVKYKRSHHQYRKFGHRQRYSRVKITGIHLKEEKGHKAHH